MSSYKVFIKNTVGFYRPTEIANKEGRVAGLEIARTRQSHEAARRAEGRGIVTASLVPAEVGHIDPCALPPRKGLGRPRGRRNWEHLYPACVSCNSTNVIRAGFTHIGKEQQPIQRYRCRDCRRSYNGAGFRIVDHGMDFELTCYRCGHENCLNRGPGSGGGRTGYCVSCRARFTQGGRDDLARYHLLLEKRLQETGWPKDVQVEALQLACVDVLKGAGYCWNVLLRKTDAFRLSRGEWGQRGSDHPVLRRMNDQKFVL
jgi:transposase-like protein